MNQLKRLEIILKLLPKKESALSIKAIHERVTAQGIYVSERSIQRDLLYLQKRHPHIHYISQGKTKFWWADKSLYQLTLLPTDAMNLVMIMNHAAKFGMAAQVENLATLRDYAISLLQGNRPNEDVSKKVVSNTRFVVLEPGHVKPEVLKAVQQALIEGSSIKAHYLKRGAIEPREMYLQPLGLSYQDSNIYLSCLVKGKSEVAALPLHRFCSVESTWDAISAPDDFDMNSFEALKGLISQRTELPVQLKLRISSLLYQRLSENALTNDQRLEPLAEGWWLMTGNLPLSQGLDLWLLSQGEHLEVLAPPELREQIYASVKKTAALYVKKA